MSDLATIGLLCGFVFMFVSASLVTAACMNSSRISRREEILNENRESKNNN